MRFTINKFLLVLCLFSFCFAGSANAQKAPKCVKVAKSHRPNWLRIQPKTLNNFYNNFGGGVSFQDMKIVKSELAYYLIATAKNDNRIFAFELELKGKRLFLNKFLPVQSCDQGELSLDTFLQLDGKIQGCRKGQHTITQLEKGKG